MLSSARRTKDRDASDRILAQAIEHVQFSVTALRGLVTVDVEVRWCGTLGPTTRHALRVGQVHRLDMRQSVASDGSAP